MSIQDLPVGRRRDDSRDLVQPTGITTAPPWDAVLDRLATLERSHADLARLVTSIHEALPPEIAAATGRSLALGSPIDAVAPPPPPPPIVGTPPPPFSMYVEPVGASAIDPYTQTYDAPDPWASPDAAPGEAFFRPLAATAMVTASTTPDRPKRRLFGGRRAAKEAQARIAAEFAAPPPPPGFTSPESAPFAAPPPPPGFTSPESAPFAAPPPPPGFAAPPPPPGFAPEGASHDFGASNGWGMTDAAPAPPHAPTTFETAITPPPPPPGFGTDFPHAGIEAPQAWFENAGASPPPPPMGFATDMAEPRSDEPTGLETLSWGSADLSSPTDFVFDPPTDPTPEVGSISYDPPTMVAVPPPPPPGFGAPSDWAGGPPPPPPGYGPSPEGGAVPPPPPPGFGAPIDQAPVVPNNGVGPGRPVHTSEVFGDAQEVTSLVAHPAVSPVNGTEEDEDTRFLAGTGTDRTSYSAVPPITPDFFARSAGKGRR